MCHWKSWIWPGILTVAILSAVALWLRTDSIEADVRAQAESRLSAAGLGWAKVEVDGRDATVVGIAPLEGQESPALEAVQDGYAVRVADARLELLAAQSPYTLGAVRADETVTVEGFLPSDAVRADVLAAAKTSFPDATIDDRTELARGAPDNLAERAAFGFGQIAGTQNGRFLLSDNDYSVSGLATSQETFGTIDTALVGELPSGLTLSERAVTPPAVSPYVTTATYDGSSVTLTGFAPDADARIAVENAAKAALPDASVTNELQLAGGAPEGFAEQVGAGLSVLPSLETGKITLTDGSLAAEGVASSSGNFDAAVALLDGELAGGATLASRDITAPSVTPYTTNFAYDGTDLRLSGLVPDDAARRTVEATAREALPNANVANELRIAAGAPEGYQAQVSAALATLPRFSEGAAGLSDGALTVRGTALTGADFEAVNAALAGVLPGGATLASADIAAPTVSPYTTTVAYDGTTARLTGSAPGTDQRDGIERAVASVLPNVEIVNELQIAAGAPEGFGAQVGGAVDLLPALTQGEASLTDGALTIRGIARTGAGYESTLAALEGELPGGAQVALAEIQPPQADSYRTGLEYDGTRAVLRGLAPDMATRDALEADVRERLPDAQIENGFTIAGGAPADLRERFATGLAYLPALATGKVDVENGQLNVSGQARDPQTYETAIARADGVGPNDAIAILPAAADDYTFKADYDGSAVTLTGLAPDRDTRSAIAAAAGNRLPGASIDNRMLIASGAPDGFQAQTEAALDYLPRLSRGSTTVDGDRIAVEGVARTSGDFAQATALDIGAAIGTATLAARDITPPAVGTYAFGADYAEDRVTLRGFVPDQATRDAVTAAAKAAQPSASVVDRLEFAAGAPAGFANRAPAVLAPLARFESGSVDLDAERLRIRGKAASVDDYEQAIASLEAGAPQGVDTSGLDASAEVAPADVSPYTFNAVRNGSAVTLTGYVPSEARRKVVVEQAGAGGREVTDELRIATGAPQGLDGRVERGLSFLGNVDEGTARVENDNLTVEGRVAKLGEYKTALATAGQADTRGVRPAIASPYRLEGELDVAADRVKLTGNVPSEAQREAIVGIARGTAAEVVDELVIADGAPDGFDGAVADGLAFLPTLDESRFVIENEQQARFGRFRRPGELETALAQTDNVDRAGLKPPRIEPYALTARSSGDAITLTGYAPDAATRDAIEASAKAANPGATVTNELQLAEGAPDEFAATTDAALTRLGRLGEGEMTLEGERYALAGRARTSADYVELSADEPNVAPPLGEGPYETRIEKNGESVVVSGAVPSVAARKTLLDSIATALPNATVEDRTTFLDGEPEGRIAELDRGLAFLTDVETGRSIVRNRALDVEGQASTVDTFDRAGTRQAEATASGAEPERINILPVTISPYSWSAVEADGKVVLEGYVPSRSEGDRIVARAAETTGFEVDDRQRIASGEPEGFAGAVDAALAEFTPLDEGVARIEGTGLALEGAAPSEAEREAVLDRVRGAIGDGFQLRDAITAPAPPAPEPAVVPEAEVPEVPAAKEPEVAAVEPKEPIVEPAVPARCNVDFAALFEGDSVLFATNRAIIRKVSYPLLDRIAAAKKDCDDASFRITGHTDSRGAERFNQALSEARAKAVRDYMVTAGVPAESLTAIGAGESKPIATNRTRAGRQRNRRIEFTIVE